MSPDALETQLAERLAAGVARHPDAYRIIQHAMVQLRDGGSAAGLAVGERAPAFELPDALGRSVSLDERLRDGAVVLVFYRGAWCPYCNLHLAALQRAQSDLARAGAGIVAISPQAPDDALDLAEREALTFDVLSDVDQRVLRAYRLQFRVPPEVQDVHLTTFGIDLSQRNADGSWNLPVPATFVVSADGIVRARHVDPDYTRRMSPEAILEALRAT